MTYNKTQLHPEKEFERHIFHRDQFAHYLRWTYVLKIADRKMNILDIGCGNANLLELLYRNKYMPNFYYGIDVRKQVIEQNKEKWKDLSFARFEVIDIVQDRIKSNSHFDIITCFEVLEHIGKDNIDKTLKNIHDSATKDSIILFSSPCYDEKVGAANNHIIEGKVGEMTFNEMESKLLVNNFIIERVFGTFASIKDYKDKLNDWQKTMFALLSEYYSSDLVSVIMAPMFPKQSRNCLWRCKIK